MLGVSCFILFPSHPNSHFLHDHSTSGLMTIILCFLCNLFCRRIYMYVASQVALVVKNLLANAGDIKDAGLIPGSPSSPGGGHGNPLQYSCLENPMDRGAWWATVHRVAQSRTRLKRLSMHTCMYMCVCFSWTRRKWLSVHTCMYMCVLLWLSHVWLCDPIDPSPPDSSVHGILQARVLEQLPSPPPGEPPDPGTEPVSPASLALAASFFTTLPLGKPKLLSF